MKRLGVINPPQGEVPEVYRQSVDTPEPKSSEVPPKVIFNYNLKHLKSFKNIRRAMKLRNMKDIFINDLSVVLKEYPPNDLSNELNDELLIEILNICEDYFFIPRKKEDREMVKRECVYKLMLPYFRNDEKLLEKTIALVYHKVKKSTLRRRCYQRFKYFFFKK